MNRFIKSLNLVATLCVSGCQSVPAPTWAIPDGVVTLPVNGYPMAYQEKGVGRTVVLLPGILCDYRCWVGQVPELSRNFRVIAVSLRHSYPEKWDGTGGDFSIAQHAKDVATLIEKIGAPVYLVGQSYGAKVAYETARIRPDLVRKLVLSEALTDSLIGSDDAANLIQRKRGIETEAFFKAGNLDGGLEFAINDINGAGAWAKMPEPVKQVIRDNAWTVVAQGRDGPPLAKCSDFGALPMPVLLVRGANTSDLARRIVEEQARCTPRAETVTIPKAGHGAPYQNAADFNAAVTTFLTESSRPQ